MGKRQIFIVVLLLFSARLFAASPVQGDRREHKYIINEETASGVREFVGAYLEPDAHCRPDMFNAYPICSLYLDSRNLVLYDQTQQGIKNRFKLRIRFYDDDPSSPAFLEIKRRVDQVIRKERAMVTRDGALRLLNGFTPDSTFQAKEKDSKSAEALQSFFTSCNDIEARGICYVSYVREAYVSPRSSQVRVTFDRQLIGGPYEQGNSLSLATEGAMTNVGGVILELKFTERYPDWMTVLAQTFNLQRTSVPKYIHCVDALGITPEKLCDQFLGITKCPKE